MTTTHMDIQTDFVRYVEICDDIEHADRYYAYTASQVALREAAIHAVADDLSAGAVPAAGSPLPRCGRRTTRSTAPVPGRRNLPSARSTLWIPTCRAPGFDH